MKKILFFVLFFFSVSYASADSQSLWNKIFTWWSLITECWNVTSHSAVHYWVPTTNNSSPWTSWSFGCIWHTYYASSTTTGSIVSKNTSTTCNTISSQTWSIVIAIQYFDTISWSPKATLNIWSWPYSWNFNYYRIICQKYDDTPPSISNITSVNPVNWSDLLATNSRYYSFVTSTTWSPISSIETFFEDSTSDNDFKTTSSECISWCNQDISNVDNLRISGWVNQWARAYSFRVSKICDEAWNCICTDAWWTILENNCSSVTKDSKLIDYSYHVYANSLNTTMSSAKVSTNDLIVWNIADWNTNNLVIQLKDIYWNEIVPSWSWIWRTIDINFNNIINNMYLDQYTRTWQSSVFSTTANNSSYNNRFSIWNSSLTSFNTQSSTNWDYDFWFHFYTPTSNQTTTASDANANFQIWNITFDVNWSLWNRVNWSIWSSSSITAKFEPLYYTSIKDTNWDDWDWLVEWSTQAGNIIIWKNSSKSTSINDLRIEFWSWLTNVTHPLLIMKYWTNSSAISTEVTWWNWSNISRATWFDNWSSYPIYTKITTKTAWAALPKNPMDYFSTHLNYTIDWFQVKTNSTVLWKESYWWTSFTKWDLAYVKVLWLTYNKWKYSETIEWQKWTDVKMLNWSITKSSLKKDMRAKAYNFIKSVKTPTISTWDTPQINDLSNFSNTTNTTHGWVNLSKNTVLYYWWLPTWNKNVLLWDWTNLTVSWKKTIIVSWWNLYIKSNILLSSTSDILWIIVLKDSKWNYWNVYIDPSVTQIKANIYTDKSLISYNWTDELDWSTTFTQLKNQLYIYGSVFSENTIWWSRASTPVCPYYVAKASCDLDTAQKYDLNYLRRYYLKSDWNPAWWVTPVKTWSLKQYPLIIEYNPKLQTTPPPLFSY